MNIFAELLHVAEELTLATLYPELTPFMKTHRGELFKDNKTGHIIKLTKDKIEFENAEKLVKSPKRVFIRYYKAIPFNDKYLLEMEKITPLNDQEWDIVDLILNSLGQQEYMLNDTKRYAFLKEMKNNPDFYEGSFKNIMNWVLLIKRMYMEAQSMDIILRDLLPQNMGKTAEGRVVHFDIGAG